MLDKEILKIILDIRSNKDNQNRCFECAMLFPNFISRNNGIFLCFVCANFHSKKLDKCESYLIEINPDDLDSSLQEAINYLFCGGNKRFREFLEFYDLKQTECDDLYNNKMFYNKYKTKAAQFYRMILENEVNGVVNYQNKNMPPYEEGREIEDIQPEIKKSNLRKEKKLVKDEDINCKDRI